MRSGTFGMIIAAVNFQHLVSAGGGPSREQIDDLMRGMIFKDDNIQVKIQNESRYMECRMLISLI